VKVITFLSVVGKGDIILVQYKNGDRMLQTGEEIFYEGKVFKIRGTEITRHLTNPVLISDMVGLRVVNNT
jgi:hypothetical protein